MIKQRRWYSELSQYYKKQRIDDAVAKLRAERSALGGLAGGFGAACIGMVVWKISYCVGGLFSSLIALVVGLVIALAIRYMGMGEELGYAMWGLVCYLVAVFCVVGIWGTDCGLAISGMDLDRFRTLDEVGLLSLIGGAIVIWKLSRRPISGELVLSELKRKDAEL